MSQLTKSNNIVALIPARGGSKGLPRKNMLPVSGKRLINWTIEAALAAKCIQHVFVTTEDEEIVEISAACGAKILTRPGNLATDDASSDAVISHAITELDKLGVLFTHICLLQPTSPLRTKHHIEEAALVLDDKQADCVISVFKSRYTVAKAYKQLDDGTLTGLFSDDAPYTPRQELPEAYFPNGAIYIFDKDKFLSRNQIPRKGIVPYVMREIDSIDIDDREDLDAVEKILSGVKNVKTNH